MKINYIILENFSNIETAMNADKIKIDFTKAKNKIILFVGPNGSGKTSILSLLTPFATVGGLDIRSGVNLIIEDKPGYKEISISKNEDEYVIKHFYTPKKKEEGHSVKSYISKNGNELNTNGNVTSFKELVKEELMVEMDYLKLIRLGSNVTSMIDLSITERKTFMNKLMEEADVYLTLYKKVSNDLKQLKNMISHAVDKMNHLQITDVSAVKEEIKRLEEKLHKKEDEFNCISGNISISSHIISELGSITELKDTLGDLKKRLSRMNYLLERKDYESTDPEFYTEKIHETDKEITQLETKNEASKLLIQNHLSRLNELHESHRELEIQLNKELESNEEITRMEKEISDMEKEIFLLRNELFFDEDGEAEPITKKEDLEEFIVFLKNIQQRLFKTYEFGKTPVKKVASLMKVKKNVLQYINNRLYNLEEKSRTDFFLERLKTRFNFSKEEIPEDCANDQCIPKQIYIQIANLIHSDIEEEDSMDITTLNSMEMIYQNLSAILGEFVKYDRIIKSFPDSIKEMFLLDSIYDKIAKCEMIYDDKLMDNFFATVTDFYNLHAYEKKRDDMKETVRKFKSISNLDYLQEKLQSAANDISFYEIKVRNLKKEVSDTEELLVQLKRDLEVYQDLKDTFSKHDTLQEQVAELEKNYDTFTEHMKVMQNLSIEQHQIKLDMDHIKEQIENLKVALAQYHSLQKDLNKYNQVYDDMVFIKDSLSSSKGIPLRFIKNYLGNIEEVTNELLDIAYNGDIYIEKFKITQNEFSIPFVNRGKLLKDVKLASQGETSFITIALAFALASQALKDYNIMLLDEMDSTVDLRFKEKFLMILENQIERIHADQCFFITHGNMFSSYPVDVVSFGDTDSEYKGTIKIEKW